jgi:flavin-dependent dehydrogenase
MAEIRLRRDGGEAIVRAQVVLVCDGLPSARSGFLARQLWARIATAPASRLGFATKVGRDAWPGLALGMLRMCLGDAGYMGLVRLSDGGVHLGAALEPVACHAAHGPLPVMRGILRVCGVEASAIDAAGDIAGTGPLTRWRNTVGRGRIMVLGDACGYVEPFTGEGISWAIRAAHAAADLLPQNPAAIPDDIGDCWHTHYTATVRPRQYWCRRLRPILARPRLAALGIRAVKTFPTAAQRLATWIST